MGKYKSHIKPVSWPLCVPTWVRDRVSHWTRNSPIQLSRPAGKPCGSSLSPPPRSGLQLNAVALVPGSLMSWESELGFSCLHGKQGLYQLLSPHLVPCFRHVIVVLNQLCSQSLLCHQFRGHWVSLKDACCLTGRHPFRFLHYLLDFTHLWLKYFLPNVSTMSHS